MNHLVIDVTSLMILSEFGYLEDVIQSIEKISVSPRTMEILLDSSWRSRFHQPSRVKAVKPLLDLYRGDKIRCVAKIENASTYLSEEVDDDLVDLLVLARKNNGRCVHYGPVYKKGSFMEELADLREYAPTVVGPIQIVNMLYREGQLDQASCEAANSSLSRIFGSQVEQELTLENAPLYLDTQSAQILSDVEVLAPLCRSSHPIFVHANSIEEWEALIGTERYAEKMADSLNKIRFFLRQGLENGKIQFLKEGGSLNNENPVLGLMPVFDMLEDIGMADAVCIDDRFLNKHPNFGDKKGHKVPLLDSLDLINYLVHLGIVKKTRRRATHTKMRQCCLFAIPIQSNELLELLNQQVCDEQGLLSESAELRAIRENLARIHSADMLDIPIDLNYLDQLWHCGLKTISSLWRDESQPIDTTIARSDWVFNHLIPDAELALANIENRSERMEALATARLVEFIFSALSSTVRRSDYMKWIEDRVIDMFIPMNPQILNNTSNQLVDWMIKRSKEIADELGK